MAKVETASCYCRRRTPIPRESTGAGAGAGAGAVADAGAGAAVGTTEGMRAVLRPRLLTVCKNAVWWGIMATCVPDCMLILCKASRYLSELPKEKKLNGGVCRQSASRQEVLDWILAGNP